MKDTFSVRIKPLGLAKFLSKENSLDAKTSKKKYSVSNNQSLKVTLVFFIAMD